MVARYRTEEPTRAVVSRKGIGGRPSKYKLEYCDEIVESGKSGYSLSAFAGSIGVCRDTVCQWRKRYPEFFAAAAIAEAAAAYTWETKLISLASGKAGNVTAIIFALKNRVKEDWRDRVFTEHVGKDDGPITIDITPETAHNLSDDKLEALEELLRMISTGNLEPQKALIDYGEILQ